MIFSFFHCFVFGIKKKKLEKYQENETIAVEGNLDLRKRLCFLLQRVDIVVDMFMC